MGTFRHPLRAAIVNAIADAGGRASPSQLADTLEQPLGNVSYHVRELQVAGILRPDGKTPRRGAIEHHYRVDRAVASAAARELEQAAKALHRAIDKTPPHRKDRR